MEEHFAVDDLLIKLMAKRKEIMENLYATYTKKIELFLQENPSDINSTISAYLEQQEDKKMRKRKRKERMDETGKRRKSMIVTVDDVSFSFGNDQLELITGQEKKVDPEVKNLLVKMNELFKQLGKK